MTTPKAWMILMWFFAFLLAACGAPDAPPPEPNLAPTQAAAAAAPTPTLPPATPTVEPSPTPLPPLSLEDIQLSDLGYLARKSTLDTDFPSGHVFAWVENQSTRTVGGAEVVFSYEAGGQETSLGSAFVSTIYPGSKVFALHTYRGIIPDNAQVTARVVSFYEDESGASEIVLEQTGEYWLRPPEQSNFAILHGTLSNLSQQAGYLSDLVALWYNPNNELVHISTLANGPKEIYPDGKLPFAIELNFITLASDSGAPLSDFTRYELAYQTFPLDEFNTKFSFSHASLPYRYGNSDLVFASGVGTNLNDTWLNLEAWWVFYDDQDQVIGLFQASRFNPITFAPNETRPFSSNLFYAAALRPNQAWIDSVARAELFHRYSSEADALLPLEVTGQTFSPQGDGYEITFTVKNPHSADIKEVQYHLSLSRDADSAPLVGFGDRVAAGNMVDVIYAKPLAAGESWPLTLYFELPEGLDPANLQLTFVARGVP